LERYIFLDNWVLSRLTDEKFRDNLSTFIKEGNYTIILTTALMSELYSPKWAEAGNRDRGLNALSFICKCPCVIVEPIKVFRAEYEHFPKKLNTIPIELDLKSFESKERLELLLGLFHRDALFLNQGIDIEQWSKKIRDGKNAWLDDVSMIIKHALHDGRLNQNEQGKFIRLDDEKDKETFLLSLDLRIFDNPNIDGFLNKMAKGANKGRLPRLWGVRITSLCFWYAYINIDKSNKLKQQGSDIVDFYHLGLIPYCLVFTVDTNMFRLLEYVARDIDISRCDLYTPKTICSAVYSV
jgi:hypothetical protein